MRVAVTIPYFDFFPELKAELAAKYSGVKFRTERSRFDEAQLIAYLKGYDAAVIGLDRFTQNVCSSLPDLKVVSLCSAGVDHIDPAILNRHDIKMWWAPGINKTSVSELAVCFMVMTLRRLHEFSALLQKGVWTGPLGFGADLRGKTVGIHGCGFIGKEVVKLLQPYGVKILASDKVDVSGFCREYGVEPVSAEELWARSDIVTIHLSKNASTLGIYTGSVLDKMKPGSILINCARGGMVDENALLARLESGHLAAAAFDVFAVEPANGHALLQAPTFFGSPHIGATTRESWAAMLRSGIYGVEHARRFEPGDYPFD